MNLLNKEVLMKHKVLLFVLVLVLLCASTFSASAQEINADFDSSFLYQGVLKNDAGEPITATCDFLFRLYGAVSGGSQVGANDTVTDVTVTDGVFTAQVNDSAEFGTTPFNGQARWLDISVRCPAGSGGYTTLSPRQPITAAPMANYASVVPWTGIARIPAGFADGVDDDTTYAAGTGVILSGGAFSVDFTSVAAANHDHAGETWTMTEPLNLQTSAENYLIHAEQTGTALNRGLIYATTAVDSAEAFHADVTGYRSFGFYATTYGEISRAVLGESYGVDGIGVKGIGHYGVVADGYSSDGIALEAIGSGVIRSTADTVLVISPFTIINRDGAADLLITYQGNASAKVRRTGTGTNERLVVFPITAPQTLYGAPMYVKALEVCYKTSSSTTAVIGGVGVYKGDGDTYAAYLSNGTDRTSTTRECFTVDATAPYKPVDESSFVQIHLNYSNVSGQPDITIYTVKLTLTEYDGTTMTNQSVMTEENPK